MPPKGANAQGKATPSKKPTKKEDPKNPTGTEREVVAAQAQPAKPPAPKPPANELPDFAEGTTQSPEGENEEEAAEQEEEENNPGEEEKFWTNDLPNDGEGKDIGQKGPGGNMKTKLQVYNEWYLYDAHADIRVLYDKPTNLPPKHVRLSDENAGKIINLYNRYAIKPETMAQNWKADFDKYGMLYEARPNRGAPYKHKDKEGVWRYAVIAGYYELHGREMQGDTGFIPGVCDNSIAKDKLAGAFRGKPDMIKIRRTAEVQEPNAIRVLDFRRAGDLSGVHISYQTLKTFQAWCKKHAKPQPPAPAKGQLPSTGQTPAKGQAAATGNTGQTPAKGQTTATGNPGQTPAKGQAPATGKAPVTDQTPAKGQPPAKDDAVQIVRQYKAGQGDIERLRAISDANHAKKQNAPAGQVSTQAQTSSATTAQTSLASAVQTSSAPTAQTSSAPTETHLGRPLPLSARVRPEPTTVEELAPYSILAPYASDWGTIANLNSMGQLTDRELALLSMATYYERLVIPALRNDNLSTARIKANHIQACEERAKDPMAQAKVSPAKQWDPKGMSAFARYSGGLDAFGNPIDRSLGPGPSQTEKPMWITPPRAYEYQRINSHQRFPYSSPYEQGSSPYGSSPYDYRNRPMQQYPYGAPPYYPLPNEPGSADPSSLPQGHPQFQPQQFKPGPTNQPQQAYQSRPGVPEQRRYSAQKPIEASLDKEPPSMRVPPAYHGPPSTWIPSNKPRSCRRLRSPTESSSPDPKKPRFTCIGTSNMPIETIEGKRHQERKAARRAQRGPAPEERSPTPIPLPDPLRDEVCNYLFELQGAVNNTFHKTRKVTDGALDKIMPIIAAPNEHALRSAANRAVNSGYSLDELAGWGNVPIPEGVLDEDDLTEQT